MKPSQTTPIRTKRYDPALRTICEAIASFAGKLAGATNAILINANMVKLNVAGIERGGTLLVIRFPVAALAREEQPLQDLLDGAGLKPVYVIHTQTETLDGAATTWEPHAGDHRS